MSESSHADRLGMHLMAEDADVAPPQPPAGKRRRPGAVGVVVVAVCRVSGVLAWVAAAVTEVLIVAVDVKSVLMMGPVICALGALTTVSARWARYPRAQALGLAHVAVCVLFFSLVNARNWSPEEAEWPFRIMGAAFVAATFVPTLRHWQRPPAAAPDPGACRGCGYALYGLPGPRCPECGLAFDAGDVSGLAPPPPAAA